MEKQYCSLHHLFHSERHCPLCIQEQAQALSKRFEKQVQVKSSHDEITETLLNELIVKFKG